MAQLKDILDLESRRTSFDEQRVVYLFPEGNFLF